MRCGPDQEEISDQKSIGKYAFACSCGLRCGFELAMMVFQATMKPTYISLFSLLAAAVSVTAEEQPGVDVKNPSTTVTGAEVAPKSAEANGQALPQELMSNQKEFLNLAEERRKDFIKNINEANRLFQQKRIFETLDQLQKAEAIFKDSSEIYNLRASCFVEMRAFDKALVDFNNALSLSKDNPSIQFNIGEVYFVTHEWQKAVDFFEKVIKDISQDNIALSRLIEFKIMLCKNKLGKKDEVMILSEKYDFLDDSPYYYYAKAALEYEVNNLVKAEEWLAIASRIFQDPNVLAPWQDTLVEYGYIKSFYGGEGGSEAE
jgi:Tfp pilus assembly protein PilF